MYWNLAINLFKLALGANYSFERQREFSVNRTREWPNDNIENSPTINTIYSRADIHASRFHRIFRTVACYKY